MSQNEQEAPLVIVSKASYLANVEETIEQAKEYARAAKAKNTSRAYKSDLADFATYCDAYKECPLPALPQIVARYLTDLASTKSVKKHPRARSSEMVEASVATISRRMVAIAQAHKNAGLPNPVADPVVRSVFQGIKRTHGTAQAKKTALTVDLLKEALATIDLSMLKGLRDRALLLLTWFTACRRSEIAALNVEDLRFERNGLAVTIRRSKTDQTGEGRTIGLPSIPDKSLDPTSAVAAWIQGSGISAPQGDAQGNALFRSVDRHGNLGDRISPQDVARLVQRVTDAAGIDGDFAAHSTRSGYITTAASTPGVTEQAIQTVSGHKSVAILRGYVQKANVFTDSPASKMFGAA
jgi:site-specific recombinase XerD